MQRAGKEPSLQAPAPDGSYSEELASRGSSRGTVSFDHHRVAAHLPALMEDPPGTSGNGVDGMARARAALPKASGRKHVGSHSHSLWGCGLLGLGPNKVQPAVISSFSDRMVKLLVRSSLDLFYVTTDDGDLLFTSVTVGRFLGYSPDELRGCGSAK